MATNEPIDAQSPFNDPKADIIIRSVDNVDFRTHRLILSLASPVFEDMFGLPQSPTNEGGTAGEMKDGLHVVCLSESSELVHLILSFSHPRCAPKVEDLGQIGDLMAVAIKYDMEGLSERLKDMARSLLNQIIEEDPIRAYAFACRFRLTDEIRKAAKRSLRIPMSGMLETPPVPELNYITGAQLHDLYRYHRKCGKVSGALASKSIWLPPSTEASVVWFVGSPGHCDYDTSSSLRNGSGAYPKKWWTEFMRASSTALENQPHGSTVTHPVLLNQALKKASACSVCRERAFDEMTQFLAVYAAEIESATAEVSIHF